MEEEKKQDELQIEENKVTRICPCCKQEYKTKVGLNNWKNLFRKPTLDDWITLFILIMLILASYAYIQETKSCKEMVNNLEETCAKYDAWKLNLTNEISVDNPLIMPVIKNQSNSSMQLIGGANYSNASS